MLMLPKSSAGLFSAWALGPELLLFWVMPILCQVPMAHHHHIIFGQWLALCCCELESNKLGLANLRATLLSCPSGWFQTVLHLISVSRAASRIHGVVSFYRLNDADARPPTPTTLWSIFMHLIFLCSDFRLDRFLDKKLVKSAFASINYFVVCYNIFQKNIATLNGSMCLPVPANWTKSSYAIHIVTETRILLWLGVDWIRLLNKENIALISKSRHVTKELFLYISIYTLEDCYFFYSV